MDRRRCARHLAPLRCQRRWRCGRDLACLGRRGRLRCLVVDGRLLQGRWGSKVAVLRNMMVLSARGSCWGTLAVAERPSRTQRLRTEPCPARWSPRSSARRGLRRWRPRWLRSRRRQRRRRHRRPRSKTVALGLGSL